MTRPRRADKRAESMLPVFIQLTRAAEAIAAALQPALTAEGLTVGQLGVLEAVVQRGPLSLRALGQCLFRSPPNMTIVVDNLERAGLARRVRSDADRRIVLVESTAEGLRRFRIAFPAYTRLIARFIGVLSSQEQARLVTLCERLRVRDGEAREVAPSDRRRRPHRGPSTARYRATR
jgi:MarR family 2-MHQ and catechol resistance regulon transcriptional repressor